MNYFSIFVLINLVSVSAIKDDRFKNMTGHNFIWPIHMIWRIRYAPYDMGSILDYRLGPSVEVNLKSILKPFKVLACKYSMDLEERARVCANCRDKSVIGKNFRPKFRRFKATTSSTTELRTKSSFLKPGRSLILDSRKLNLTKEPSELFQCSDQT